MSAGGLQQSGAVMMASALAGAVALAGLAMGAPLAAETAGPAHTAEDYRADAQALVPLVRDNYAYLDDLPGGVVPQSAELDAERDAVHDETSLLHYAEDVITTLADHHALTTRSFGDDWALVPSFSDIWIVRAQGGYRVDAVKPGSPAAQAGVQPGYRLIRVGDVPVDRAVADFWSRLGLRPEGERAAYAARVLAAGRRDRSRNLTFATPQGERTFALDSLYRHQDERPALTTGTARGVTTIRFNNSIGDLATIAAFDAAMAGLPPTRPVVIDLTDTPSGGTTSVARAILGWFVKGPRPYQMHQLPAEERETGVPRQWVEYVLPRAGKFHPGRVQVRVGRWTGSMGEGLAAGFMAMSLPVCGTRMAGLKGAVYDFDLPKTGLRVKFPAERLYTLNGTPRQALIPPACR